MLAVHGLVGIPKDIDIKEYPTEKGVNFYFNVIAQDAEQNQWHRYNCKLWVPKSERDKWIDMLKPRTVVYIEQARWSAMKYDKGINHTLILDCRKFKVLDKHLWIKKEDPK